MTFKTRDEAVKAVIRAARKEIGYKALSGKENKYGHYLDGIPGYYNGKKTSEGWGADWCDIFVDAIFLQTFGNPTGREMLYQPEKSLGAGCVFSANYFIKYGAWSNTPVVGSQGFLGKRGDEYHTGIVTAVSGNQVTLIEGNAGGGNGQVMERTWSKSEFSGFGLPDYDMVVREVPDPKETIDDITTELNKLAKGVLAGEYGSGKTRVDKLGAWYEPVQWIINKYLKYIK